MSLYQGWGTGSPEYPFYPYYGYTYLGPVQMPPDAMYVGMTDRETGVVWYLCFDPCYGGRVALVDWTELPFSKFLSTRVYAPYDGPYIGAQGLRLGVRNGQLLFESTEAKDSGSPPWAFDLSGNRMLWDFLFPVIHDNPNTWDHLAYDGYPGVFFGLTDRDTGEVVYVVLDHTTQRVALQDTTNIPAALLAQVKVYTGFDGPAVWEENVKLGARGGHLLWEISTEERVLIPTLAFDSLGAVTQAAQFSAINLNGQSGVADQPPDHVTYAVVSPITNECPDGPGSITGPVLVLVTDDDEIILADDETLQQPD